jgi:hypothetical protein
MAVVPIPLARSRVTVQVGEGEFECELDIGALEDLQSLTGLGPEKLIERLQNGEWWVGEIRHIIRLGLQTGGMDPNQALAIINRNVKPPYLQFYVPVAYTILLAAVAGIPEHDPLGEPPAATEMTTEFETTETNDVFGDFPNSTE